MRRHLPPPAAGVEFGKVFQAKLMCRHTAAEDETAITIIRNNIIVRFHLDRNRSQRFMAHSRDVKMSFALAIQILLAQIGVAALQNYFEEPKFGRFV